MLTFAHTRTLVHTNKRKSIKSRIAHGAAAAEMRAVCFPRSYADGDDREKRTGLRHFRMARAQTLWHRQTAQPPAAPASIGGKGKSRKRECVQ